MLLVREALSEHCRDCVLDVISDGEAALRWVDEQNCNGKPKAKLVIVDLKLPRRSGHEVLEHMKANECCARIPTIVLTSSEAKLDRDRVEALGFARFLTKPPLLDDFIELMGTVLREVL